MKGDSTWAWLSRYRKRAGRNYASRELRELIFRTAAENPTCGAPQIHGELKMLGFEISERTVLNSIRKAPKDVAPAKRWAAFLSNHREAIAAMDITSEMLRSEFERIVRIRSTEFPKVL